MAHRLDYYFRQKVSESELDAGFGYLEDADLALAVDNGRIGIMSGLGLSQAGTPNLTVQCAAGIAYDKTGRRCSVPSTQVINCALDYLLVATTVAAPGNEKWISLFLVFDRALSDPRTDGASLTVYFDRAESFALRVVQGAEAAAGLAVKPALDGTNILLADVLLAFGTTAITNVMLNTSRRENSVNVSGSTTQLKRGKVNDALADILVLYDSHIDGSGDRHPAADVDYGGGGTYLGGITNPATTVEAQLDKIISDLNTYFGTTLRPRWFDAVADGGSGQVTTSATFEDVTGCSIAVTGGIVNDLLEVHLYSELFCQAGVSGEYRLVVDDGTAVTVLDVKAFSDASPGASDKVGFHLKHTVINAGTQTVKAQIRRTAGANNAQVVTPWSLSVTAYRQP